MMAGTTDTPKRRRIDWDAVERDYRVTQMTLRELAAKHGCTHGAVAQQAKKKGWTRDLTPAVRHATNAKLVQATLDAAVNESAHELSGAVMAAAEINSRIVMIHRKRLADLHRLVERAKEKLEQAGEMLVDVREAATFVQAAGNLAAATTRLIDAERKAFGLDDEVKKGADTIEELLMAIANER